MKSKKKKYVGVSVPLDLLAWLEETAAAESRTRSNLIVKLLEEARNARRQ